MKTIRYNKLVRDKIPEIIRKDNAIPKLSILSNNRFKKELKKKLVEEAKELANAKDRTALTTELADVLEIAKNISREEKIDWKSVEGARKERQRKRGGFKKKIFLKEVKK